jgi:hypothetical protein
MTIDPLESAASGADDRDAADYHSMQVARGNLYLCRALCARYFPHSQCVALIEREGQVLLLPLVHESAGGLLLKLRNREGDRVIHAQEFLREHGYLEDFEEHSVQVFWSSERAALILKDLPRAKS